MPKPSSRKAVKLDADVIIVGGGLGGLALAALLGSHDIRVICIDRDPPPDQIRLSYDGRTTAISYGSRKVLEAAGLWDDLERARNGACPIDTIHILDGDAPRDGAVPLVFDKSEAGGRTFGWIVENRDFRQCLFTRVKALPSVRHIAPCAVTDFAVEGDGAVAMTAQGDFRAPLIIGADGRHSALRAWMGTDSRAWDYGQQAVVSCVTHAQPHNNIAVEHFRHEGPFAILPMMDDAQGRHRSSVVWTVHGDAKKGPLGWSDAAFNAGLTARFPDWYGAVALDGPRFAFPLSLSHAHNYIGPRMALIAEAAHAIHPIAGQGLNLGLRDVASLSSLIVDAVRSKRDPGDEALLQAYQRQRRPDNMMMAGATDTLNRLFSNDLPGMGGLRRVGLKAVSRSATARRFFMKQAMGAAGILPGLLRDSPT